MQRAAALSKAGAKAEILVMIQEGLRVTIPLKDKTLCVVAVEVQLVLQSPGAFSAHQFHAFPGKMFELFEFSVVILSLAIHSSSLMALLSKRFLPASARLGYLYVGRANAPIEVACDQSWIRSSPRAFIPCRPFFKHSLGERRSLELWFARQKLITRISQLLIAIMDH